MDKAKAAITDFMGRSGHHDTTVHEAVAPAVTQEVVKPHVHEEINTAIDKEVHQDHYHRTIQPVQDREVLPERHEAKIGAVQHREFDHRDHESTKRNLIADQARFKDERRIDDTTHSQSVAPTVGGEHVHHHIHETIQPVVQKETIQPSVVHTTVPIHEVHHNKATHHDTTALPAMTMEQFKAKVELFTAVRSATTSSRVFPRTLVARVDSVRLLALHTSRVTTATSMLVMVILREQVTTTPMLVLLRVVLTHNSTTAGLGHTHNPADRNNDGRVDARDLTGSTGHSGHTMNPADRNNDGRVDRHDMTDSSRDRNIGATGTRAGTDGAIGTSGTGDLAHRENEDGSLPKALTEDKSKAVPHSALHDNQHSTGSGSGYDNQKKPGLMDKLNPKVDSNGDGKAGFMK